jgi:hypothetical protein
MMPMNMTTNASLLGPGLLATIERKQRRARALPLGASPTFRFIARRGQ